MPADPKQNALERFLRAKDPLKVLPAPIEARLADLADVWEDAQRSARDVERSIGAAKGGALSEIAATDAATDLRAKEALREAQDAWERSFGGGERSKKAFIDVAKQVQGRVAAGVPAPIAATAATVATAPRIENPVTPAGRRKKRAEARGRQKAADAARPKAKINQIRPVGGGGGSATVGGALEAAGVAGATSVANTTEMADLLMKEAGGDRGKLRGLVDDLKGRNPAGGAEVEAALQRWGALPQGPPRALAGATVTGSAPFAGTEAAEEVVEETVSPKRGRAKVKTEDELVQEAQRRGGERVVRGTKTSSRPPKGGGAGIAQLGTATGQTSGVFAGVVEEAATRRPGLGTAFGREIAQYGVSRQAVQGFLKIKLDDVDRLADRLIAWQQTGGLGRVVQGVRDYGTPEQITALNERLMAAKGSAKAGKISAGLDALIYGQAGTVVDEEVKELRRLIKKAKQRAGTSTTKWRKTFRQLLNKFGQARLEQAGIFMGAEAGGAVLTGELALTQAQQKAADEVMDAYRKANELDLNRPADKMTATERGAITRESERRAALASREAAARNMPKGPPAARTPPGAPWRPTALGALGRPAAAAAAGTAGMAAADIAAQGTAFGGGTAPARAAAGAGKWAKFLRFAGPISWALLGLDIMMRLKGVGDQADAQFAQFQGGLLGAAAGQDQGLEQLLDLRRMDEQLGTQVGAQEMAGLGQLRQDELLLEELLRGDEAFARELERIL